MISVVIPSFKRKDSILSLLRDLYQQDYHDFEVVVVDDCSPDDSVEAFKAAFPQTKLFRNEKNGGPAVTRNRAIREAKGEIVVGVDSDVSIQDRSLLSKVAKAFERNPEAMGFAFRLFAEDGVTDDLPRWWHPVKPEGMTEKHFETDYFSGTGYAFRKQAVLQAGLFPEYLYMHYEEVELAYRLIDSGAKLFYNPDLTVVHHAQPTPRRSIIKTYYKPRNQILIAISCYPWPKALGYLIPRIGYAFLFSIKNLSLGQFVKAMRSAASMASQTKARRKPMTKETLARMKWMKTQVGT